MTDESTEAAGTLRMCFASVAANNPTVHEIPADCDPVAEYMAGPLGKMPPVVSLYDGGPVACPTFSPCRCGLLVPSPPCMECGSRPAIIYLTGGREGDVSMSSKRTETSSLLILGALVLTGLIVVANSMSGVHRPGDGMQIMEAQ